MPLPHAAPSRIEVPRLSDPLRRVLKRGLDLAASSVGLMLLLPLFFLITLAIRRESPGPVLFSQLRVGHNRRRCSLPMPPGRCERRVGNGQGLLFRLYKFRTMHADTPSYSISPRDHDDPRITRVGRLLRQTSFDELPQLVNVLRGEMSLVGPRPEMPFIVAGYDDVQRRRLLVKQGLTGLWQLSGPRDRAIHEAIGYDLNYVENWSLRLDLRILFETLAFCIRARNH
jgi:lipopolysaccharide/colanic/teichoic acid biosynthesis glycosyltransferase